MNLQDHKIFFLLDEINPHAIKTWIKHHQKIVDYTAQHYAFFASRRSQMMEDLKQALRDEQREYILDKPWSRIVSQQYSNTPLSTTGSVLSIPGGRFNIGNIDTERFPQFPVLYLAEDIQTAYLECFGLSQNKSINGLTANELSVAGNFSYFQMTGRIAQLLDLTEEKNLTHFYECIKNIELPIYFRREARNLSIKPPSPINSLKQLFDTLFAEQWRLIPMQLDVPANSQILGQIAKSAGLEGILYPSVKSGHLSLCIFPDNFKDSESYIEIIGDVANTVLDRRLDKSTYGKFLPTRWR